VSSVYLSGNSDFIIHFISHWALLFIGVIKRYADSGFGNTSLAILVYQLLQVSSPHLLDKEEFR
jgi:hypothetical protein